MEIDKNEDKSGKDQNHSTPNIPTEKEWGGEAPRTGSNVPEHLQSFLNECDASRPKNTAEAKRELHELVDARRDGRCSFTSIKLGGRIELTDGEKTLIKGFRTAELTPEQIVSASTTDESNVQRSLVSAKRDDCKLPDLNRQIAERFMNSLAETVSPIPANSYNENIAKEATAALDALTKGLVLKPLQETGAQTAADLKAKDHDVIAAGKSGGALAAMATSTAKHAVKDVLDLGKAIIDGTASAARDVQAKGVIGAAQDGVNIAGNMGSAVAKKVEHEIKRIQKDGVHGSDVGATAALGASLFMPAPGEKLKALELIGEAGKDLTVAAKAAATIENAAKIEQNTAHTAGLGAKLSHTTGSVEGALEHPKINTTGKEGPAWVYARQAEPNPPLHSAAPESGPRVSESTSHQSTLKPAEQAAPVWAQPKSSETKQVQESPAWTQQGEPKPATPLGDGKTEVKSETPPLQEDHAKLSQASAQRTDKADSAARSVKSSETDKPRAKIPSPEAPADRPVQAQNRPPGGGYSGGGSGAGGRY